MSEIKLILDDSVLNEYNKYYFRLHPKAKKKPIERPIHPSINVWVRMPRMQMNQLKQKWKDFGIWWINHLGYQNFHLENFEIEFSIFMPTRRRSDPDNQSPKFILDFFTETGFIVDDDGEHLKSLTIRTRYDKDYPRTEILIRF